MSKPKPMSKKRMMEMMAAESRITGDRISGLPEPILQHIFSFLDTKQAVQASVLGRSWRYLWASLPVLNFDNIVWKKKNQKMFKHFIDQVFKLRFSNSPIRKFNIFYSIYISRSQVLSWISAAQGFEAEEIHLVVWYENPLDLPDCIFTSSTRVFNLKGAPDSETGEYLLRTPISMCSSRHLRTLQLESVILPEGDSNDELKFDCPMLESLSITDCEYNKIRTLSICTPLLEYLLLDNKNSYHDNRVDLKIRCPKLKSFKCIASMYKKLSVESSADPFSAEIEVRSYSDAERMIALLKGLWMANSLTVTECSLQVFLKFPHMLEALPADHFRVLKYLRLKRDTSTSSPEDHIAPELNLFKIFRGVETLVVEGYKNFALPRVNPFDPACLFQYTFDGLKFLEVRYLQGCETELQFLEFVFENSLLLEKVTITTTIKLQQDAGELAAFKRKLLSLAGAFNYGHIICFKD